MTRVIDEYLDALDEQKRTTLQELRRRFSASSEGRGMHLYGIRRSGSRET